MLTVKKLSDIHPFSSNTYLLISGDEYAVVDPSTPPTDGVATDCNVRYVLLTHGHFDHMLDIDAWVSLGAEVIVSESDALLLGDSELNCYKPFLGVDRGYVCPYRTVRGGDVLPFGDTVISVISCPGHTAGSLTYLIDGVAFVGDTVFEGGGFGRWDLPSGDLGTLFTTVSELLSTLPDDTLLYCGHGNRTTIGEYKTDYKYRRI